MVPKKCKDFIPEQAKQLGIPEEDLSAIIRYYYAEVKRNASDLLYPNIRMKGLGVFEIKGWELEKSITEHLKLMDAVKEKTKNVKSEHSPISSYKLNKQLNALTTALDKWKEEKEYLKTKRILKSEFYKNKNKDYDIKGKDSTSLEK